MLRKRCRPALARNLVRQAYALALTVFLTMPASAQQSDTGFHGSWPINLDLTTITGQVSVDSSLRHEAYYLDEDGDGEADIRLEFGPFWYRPDSGAARPDSGSTITVTGLLRDMGAMPTLVVFELDGASWREPVEYGMHGWTGSDSWMSSFDTLTVTGAVLVDTTYYYRHYYLDTDDDSLPDYQLVFGPQWYEPTSGAGRPEAGTVVTVFGATHEAHGAKKLIVFELDGLEWREFGGPATWAGHWMDTDHADSTYAYCVNDSASWIEFPPGHAQGGMGGMHWPDSTFVELWRIPPDSLPGGNQPGRFAGFFVDVHDPSGGSMMGQGFGGHQGMMSFARNLRIRIHYHDEDLPGDSEEGMQVLAWDEEMHQWMPSQHAVVNTETNEVLVTGSDLNNYYVLAASDVATGIASAPEIPARGIELYQNFPNPFAGETEISYRLFELQHVELDVFDLLGRKLATLVDEVQAPGYHDVRFADPGRPNGVYLYRLRGPGVTSTRRMVLVR